MPHNRGITGGQISGCVQIDAAAAIDARDVVAPARLILDNHRIIALGTPQAVGEVPGAGVIDARGEVLMPGLVNSHAHLDLSGPGPVAYGGHFEAWLQQVLDLRFGSGPTEMTAAVNRGVQWSLAGGTAFIGDIAGIPQTPQIDALEASPLGGVSYPEFFGLGDRQEQTISEMDHALRVDRLRCQTIRCGLSPHAPYTCGPDVIEAAFGHESPVAIHVAESPAERRFLSSGDGPFRQLAERLGAWNQGVTVPGVHPIDFVLARLDAARPVARSPAEIMLVHLNDVLDEHLPALARAGVTVAYCPRASAYFGYPEEGGHRYRDLLDHGVPVALGTDSLLCLDTPDRIGVLDEMRFLHRRDGTDVHTLMRMATVVGAEALGVPRVLVDFSPGPIGGVLAVQTAGARWQDVLTLHHPPRWIQPPIVDSTIRVLER